MFWQITKGKAEVEFSVDVADGELTETTGLTNSDGEASTSYFMGALSAVITARVVQEGIDVPSATVLLTSDPFVYDHTESTITGTLDCDGGPTTEVEAGSTRGVTVHVEKHAWEVWKKGGQ